MARKKIKSELVVSAAAPARQRTVRRTKAAAAESAPAEPAPPEIVSSQRLAPAYAPAHEEIARLAYSYWESRGSQSGSPEEDWTRAETELRARPAAAVA